VTHSKSKALAHSLFFGGAGGASRTNPQRRPPIGRLQDSWGGPIGGFAVGPKGATQPRPHRPHSGSQPFVISGAGQMA